MRHPSALLLPIALLFAAAPPAPAGAQSQGGGIARYDRNGNGTIERDEAPPAIQSRFAELDTDGNGSLDRDELVRAFMGRGDQPPPPAALPVLPAGPPSWDRVTAIVDAMVAQRKLPGAFLEVARGGEVLYSHAFGDYTRDTVLNIASATKWVTSAVLMTIVESDGVEIDAPIARYLPWIPKDKSAITLGELLSHTSGLPSIRDNPIDLRQGVAISLDEAARQIAALALSYPPGTTFAYGGASFQLAGEVAQTVTGKSWESLFQERIARPLGMAASRYRHPSPELEGATEINNPNLQAGLFTSPADYLRFLAMIDGRGMLDGKRVLPAELVDTMERTRLAGVEKKFVPGGADPRFEYGLGLWCETVEGDGRCSVVSSPGAWGTYPWIDHPHRVRGLLFVKDRLPDIVPWVDAARIEIDAILDQP